LPRRVAVQRAAFGARTVTNEANYAEVMQTPDYRRALDVVVVAPDGTFVAFCLGWYDAFHRMGMIEPVGTDPGRREKGFARAAVLEVLRCFQMMGAKVAQVCHDLDNVAARRLYECVGFREEERLYKYRKALR
jgi:ribosomal protein S18 acetylase RimI-like enzyme